MKKRNQPLMKETGHYKKYLFVVYLKLAKIHTEVQTPFAQYLLDFSQRFLPEIPELHQVLLLIRHQLAETIDLGGFQTVESAYGKIQILQRSLEYLAQLEGLFVNQILFLLFLIIESNVFVSDDHQVLDQD